MHSAFTSKTEKITETWPLPWVPTLQQHYLLIKKYMNASYKSLCIERATFTLTEIYFPSKILLKVQERPAASLKKSKAVDVRSKWINQLLILWVETHIFVGVPSSLVSIRAKSKIHRPCKSQSLQYSTEVLQNPLRPGQCQGFNLE